MRPVEFDCLKGLRIVRNTEYCDGKKQRHFYPEKKVWKCFVLRFGEVVDGV
jgi:hypothetical protein